MIVGEKQCVGCVLGCCQRNWECLCLMKVEVEWKLKSKEAEERLPELVEKDAPCDRESLFLFARENE